MRLGRDGVCDICLFRLNKINRVLTFKTKQFLKDKQSTEVRIMGPVTQRGL